MKISIVVPCYNSEKFVEECIESIYSQTYKNYEVIAIDNESTDDTLKILRNIQLRHPELIVDTAKNIHPRCWDEAKEKGFSLSTGDYLTQVASDDFLKKRYLENCVRYISHDTERIKLFQSGVTGFKVQYRSNDKFLLKGTKEKTSDLVHSYNSLKRFKEMCLSYCPVASPTVFYARELYEKGLLKTNPVEYSGAADYDLYCKLADKGHFMYPSKRVLGYWYRWHDKQATWEMLKDPTDYDKKIKDYWRAKWDQ